MGTTGDILLAVAGLLAVLALPLEAALGVVLGFWLLVPGLLSVPLLPHVVLVDRVVLWGFGLRLVLRAHRAGETSRGAFRFTPVHAAIAALLAVWWFAGVAGTPSGTSVRANIDEWLHIVDVAVLFVAVLAVARTIGFQRVARLVVGFVAACVVIGFFEWVGGHSWGNFFFEHIPARYVEPGAGPLIYRGNSPRPSVSAQFALEYGWVLVFFFGLVLATSLRWARVRWRRWRHLPLLALALPLLTTVVVLLSKGRSPEVALPVAVVLMVALGGADRRMVTVAGAAGLLALGMWIFHPQLFSSAFVNADPLSLRLNRLPAIFSDLVGHQWTGLSFVGIQNFGGLDNGYAFTYAQVGMLGLLAWVVLLVTVAATAVSALRAPRDSDARLVGAACLVGIVAVACASGVYDLTSLSQSRWAVAVLAALAVAARESIALPAPADRRWALRSVFPVAGAALGLLVLAVFPSHAGQRVVLEPIPASVSAQAKSYVDAFTGLTAPNTICDVLTSPSQRVEGTTVQCLPSYLTSPFVFPAQIAVTVWGPTADAVHREVRSIMHFGRTTVYYRGGPTELVQMGKPMLVETAPVSGAVLGILVMFLLPPRRRLRRPLPLRPPNRRALPATVTAASG